jgi:hypothetical protein
MTSSFPYNDKDLRPMTKSSTAIVMVAVDLLRLGFNKGQMLKGKDRVRKKKKKEGP